MADVKKIKLPIRAKSLDAIPAQFRDRYVEENGEFVLSQDVEIEDVNGLKSALEKERTTARDLEKAFKPFEGLDPEKITKLQEESAAAEKKKLEDRGEYTRLLGEQQQKFDKQLAELKKERDDLNIELEDLALRGAIDAGLKPFEASSKLLYPHLKSELKVVRDEHGKIVRDEHGIAQVQPVDAKGNPRIGTTGEMTFAELIGSMKEKTDYAPAFPGTTSTGTGARNEGPPTTSAGGARRKIPSGVDINDGQQYNRLQEQANREGITFLDNAGAIAVAPQPKP